MTPVHQPTVCIIGGGAAGFFGAIACAEHYPDIKVIILEQNKTVLNKVKISGGGRCNVTHACFDPRELITFYPRGSKELLGPFNKFQPGDTMDWFEKRGVSLKIEEDNRVFPESDDSQTIIDCLIKAAKSLHIQIWNSTKITGIGRDDKNNHQWLLRTATGQPILADYILVATGSSPMVWEMLEGIHTIIDPVPSLFTFNIQHILLKDLQGISVPDAEIRVEGQKLETSGPLLITHWGLSGPAVLKMSAWGARLFHAMNYRFKIQVNWTGLEYHQAAGLLERHLHSYPKKQVSSTPLFNIPSRLWKRITEYTKLPEAITWQQLDPEQVRHLLKILVFCQLPVNGKSTFKDEFVTAGGIALEEVDFRTMESKKTPHLYLAGEVLDIDALTGGFNFQAAWTTGYLAGRTIAQSAAKRS